MDSETFYLIRVFSPEYKLYATLNHPDLKEGKTSSLELAKKIAEELVEKEGRTVKILKQVTTIEHQY